MRNDWSGLQLFARYAYPPNERGYCGPADHRALLEYRTTGQTDPGLAQLASAFTGPWPYLKLMSEKLGVGDPFDYRIVEAYWVGNKLLDRVGTLDFGNTIEHKFKPRVGRRWQDMSDAIPWGVPHHSFHVFVTYPWVGLLEESDRGEPLQILDQCRIRWGQVVSTSGDQAIVKSQPLVWEQKQLRLGAMRLETATLAKDGLGFTEQLDPGEWVSLHWTWVCDRLSKTQLQALRTHSIRQLQVTNRKLARPGPAMVLG